MSRRIPGAIVALFLGTAAVALFGWPVETIGTRFGGIPSGLPAIHLPFTLTVFADLTVAVGVGMVLAALLFIRRVADTTTVSAVTDDYVRDGHVHSLHNKTIPAYVRIYRIHGPFLFGATDKLRPILDAVETLPEIVVLRLRNMTALDATGLRAIEELAHALQDGGRWLLVCGARNQPAQLMKRSGFHEHVGAQNVCANVEDALERARQLHGASRPGAQ